MYSLSPLHINSKERYDAIQMPLCYFEQKNSQEIPTRLRYGNDLHILNSLVSIFIGAQLKNIHCRINRMANIAFQFKHC